MAKVDEHKIPTVSLTDSYDSIVQNLDKAFKTFGFCVCIDTGISPCIISSAIKASQRFHGLSDDIKAGMKINSFHRGYIAPESSTIYTSTVAKVTRPNTSASFMIMNHVSEDDPKFGQPLQGVNQWPNDLPGFQEVVESYRVELEILARRLTLITLDILGVSHEFYDQWFREPTEFLRLLHYPPEGPDTSKNSFGSAPHTDHGFLTIVAQDDVGGLEVQIENLGWVPVHHQEGSVVINVADILSHLSGSRWLSSPHRVKNIFNRDRYSIAYFFDPAMDAEITPVVGKGKTVNYGNYILSKFDTNYDYRASPP